MLAALFFYTFMAYLLFWVIKAAYNQYCNKQKTKSIQQDIQKKSDHSTLKRSVKFTKLVSLKNGSDSQQQKNTRQKRESNKLINGDVSQKKIQRQIDQQENKLQLRLSSNCSENDENYDNNQAQLEEYIQNKVDYSHANHLQNHYYMKQDQNQESSSPTRTPRFLNNNYLNTMTTVKQLSEEYRPSERDHSNRPSEQDQRQYIYQNEIADNMALEGMSSDGINTVQYRSVNEKQKMFMSESDLCSDLRLKQSLEKSHMSDRQKKKTFRQKNRSRFPQIEKSSTKKKTTVQQEQIANKKIDTEKQEIKQQANSKEDAQKPNQQQNKHQSIPQPSQQQNLSKNPSAENSKNNSVNRQHEENEHTETNINFSYSKNSSRVESLKSQIPLILVHQTFKEVIDGPKIYKYDKSSWKDAKQNQKQNGVEDGFSAKNKDNYQKSSFTNSKQSLSERSYNETVYKKDLTKLLQQIDSFFMNNSNGSNNKSNQKTPDSGNIQQPTQNYDISSGGYYYSGQKSASKSDIVQEISAHDFKGSKQKADTQNQYPIHNKNAVASLKENSQAGESYLNISSKKGDSNSNKRSIEDQIKHQSDGQKEAKTVQNIGSASHNYLAQPSPRKRVKKRKKKVSKTEKFKQKQRLMDGDEDEESYVEQSDYPYDDDESQLESMISYNKVQEDIITQLESKIKKLINTVGMFQNKHDALLKEVSDDKQTRDNLVKRCRQLQNEKTQREAKLSQMNNQKNGMQSSFNNQQYQSLIQQLQGLKQANRQYEKKQQEYIQEKFMLEEKYKDLEIQWQQQKNNHDILIQGYQEKIKAQGQIIEQSLRRIRKLEGLDSGYDDYEDQYEYYVQSNQSMKEYSEPQHDSQEAGSERTKRLHVRKSSLRRMNPGHATSKKSTPSQSFRQKNNQLVEIAQQITGLQQQYNKAKQQTNCLTAKLTEIEAENNSLRQKLQIKQTEYLKKLNQMENQLETINKKAQDYLQKYESLSSKYEQIYQQLLKKQQQMQIIDQRGEFVSTTAQGNHPQNQQNFAKLFDQFKTNNDNLSNELEFCQQQIKLMIKTQKQLKQQINALKRNPQFNQNQKHNTQNSPQIKKLQEKNYNRTHEVKNSNFALKQSYQQIKRKYQEMKNQRLRAQREALDSPGQVDFTVKDGPPQRYKIYGINQYRNLGHYSSSEQNIQQASPAWRKNHLASRYQYNKNENNHSYLTSTPRRKKNISITSKNSDYPLVSNKPFNKSQQRSSRKLRAHSIKIISDFFLTSSHPYLQFLSSILRQNEIKFKNSYKIFSALNQEHINKSSLKTAINNIQNIFILCKIRDQFNNNKIVGAFSSMPLTRSEGLTYRQKKNVASKNITGKNLGILFDFNNFIFYKNKNTNHYKSVIASYDQYVLVWGYNQFLIDTDQPRYLYINYNSGVQRSNNIYWESLQQFSSFISNQEQQQNSANTKKVEIEGFQIFALSR